MTALEDRTVPTPVVTIAALADVTEGAGATTAFRLTRSDATGSLSVGFSPSGGTATTWMDYTFPFSATFAPGSATADITITPTNDTASEPTETITFALHTGVGYTVGTPSSATVDLYDNDAVVVSVTTVSDVAEGNYDGQFLVTRTGDLSATPTVGYTLGGTATSGVDYLAQSGSFTFVPGSATAGLFFTALRDNLVEGDETITLTLTSGSGYTVSTPNTATLTITDDPPVITVKATDTAEGSATGGFGFRRTGGDLTQSLGFTYSIGGTATPGTDYTALSGSLSFGPGVDYVSVWVEAIGDDTNDDGETVTATLTGGGTNYVIGSPGGSGTVTIGDQATTVSVVALNDGAEGGANPTFRITRSGDITGSLSVGYTLSGTATSGTDYTAPSGSVSFSANETSKDVTISLADDTTAESTETITLTLDPPSSAYTLGNDSDTVFVKDNERGRVVWMGGASAGPNDWNIAANWESGTVPTEDDDVYFDGELYNDWSCENVGSSLTGPLYGMHIINGFSPLLILAQSLTVINYEQQSAILNQPSQRDLTVTGTMLWTGGTLDATASGAKVNIDGAVGRFDPPDTGGMSTSSWLRVVNSADITVLPGKIIHAAGNGLFLRGYTVNRVSVR